MDFPPFAYSQLSPPTGCGSAATEHPSNQFRPQAGFPSRADEPKDPLNFISEICKELPSGSQTSQLLPSSLQANFRLWIEQLLMFNRSKQTGIISPRIQRCKAQLQRPRFPAALLAQLFPIWRFCSPFLYLPPISTSASPKLYLVDGWNWHSFLCSLFKYYNFWKHETVLKFCSWLLHVFLS